MFARRLLCCCLCAVLVAGTATIGRSADVVDAAKIDALVKPLVDGGWIYGVAIGLIDEHGTQELGYGRVSETNPAAPGPDTLFEIGSITKVFTSTILARMVEEGRIKLDDPVQQLLAHTIIVPKGKERQITLQDLATHSSGLPRMPSNFSPKDAANPYADYTVLQMGAFLARHKLRREPGAKSEYSNLGVGLLGHALALKSGFDYESLVESEICGPLGMSQTRITLDDDDRQRLAIGHDYDGNPVANWDLPALAGAGAIRSTTHDMLKFLAAQLGMNKSTLAGAIAKTQSLQYKNPDGQPFDMGLGWLLQRSDNIVWHNGGTGGYNSFAAFQPDKKRGVVVLANTSTKYVDLLGFKLLKLIGGSYVEPLPLPKTVTLPAEKLAPLVGKYKLTPQLTADVTLEGERLYVQLTGQPRIGIYAKSETEFYCRPVEATFDFEAGENGQIERLVIHQNGQDIPAQRVAEEAKSPAG